MNTKKVIFLPKADSTPPSDMRILTAKQAERVLKDKTKTWREFIPPPTTKEGGEGIIIITRFGSTEFWESHNMSFGLDFGISEDKPAKTKPTDAEIWQGLMASLSKYYKKEDK